MSIRRPQFSEVLIKGRTPDEIKAYEEKKKLEKEAADKKPKVKQMKYFDIKVETVCPTMITYRVYAETEVEALELIKTTAPISIKPDINKRKQLKAKVYDSGGSIIRYTKSYTS